jgi:hypothetical protein
MRALAGRLWSTKNYGSSWHHRGWGTTTALPSILYSRHCERVTTQHVDIISKYASATAVADLNILLCKVCYVCGWN